MNPVQQAWHRGQAQRRLAAHDPRRFPRARLEGRRGLRLGHRPLSLHTCPTRPHTWPPIAPSPVSWAAWLRGARACCTLCSSCSWATKCSHPTAQSPFFHCAAGPPGQGAGGHAVLCVWHQHHRGGGGAQHRRRRVCGAGGPARQEGRRPKGGGGWGSWLAGEASGCCRGPGLGVGAGRWGREMCM